MNRRKKITREDGTRWSYGYNAKGEVTSGSREKTGALNTAVPGWNHGYTFDEIGNRLIAMETHATVPLPARRKLAFAYDSMGRRIHKTVWHGINGGGWQLHHKFDFIHELGGWNILAERSGGSTGSFLRTYTWGTDLSGTHSGAGGVGGLLFTTLHTSGKTFANGMDLNGNVTLLVDTATGQSAATYDYGPFGEPLRQSGEYATLNPYRFSTKYTDDESGWLDYGYRYYDPATGRWPSRDPIEEEGGINLYGFVGNNGIGRIDRLGLSDWDYDGQGLHGHEGRIFGKNLTYVVDFDENGQPHFSAKKGHEKQFDLERAKTHFQKSMRDKAEVVKIRSVCKKRFDEVSIGGQGDVAQNGRGVRRFKSKGGFFLMAMVGVLTLDPAQGEEVRFLQDALGRIRENLEAGKIPDDSDIQNAALGASQIYGGTYSYVGMEQYLKSLEPVDAEARGACCDE